MNVWSADNILFLDLGVPYAIKFSFWSGLSTYILYTFLYVYHTLKIYQIWIKVNTVKDKNQKNIKLEEYTVGKLKET